MGLSTWRWLRRLRRIRRLPPAQDHRPVPAAERPLPGDARTLQRRSTGVGSTIHRRYRVRIADSPYTSAELLDTVATHLNAVSPVEVAEFKKVKGTLGRLKTGDEYVVQMPGPWDGPVRVIDRDETSFRFVTLRGHMEAGEILFRTSSTPDDLIFEIESWARSGDRFFAFLYDHLWVAREMQLHMWVHVLERVAALADGRVVGKIDVQTSKVA
jgi:hypothetical protein